MNRVQVRSVLDDALTQAIVRLIENDSSQDMDTLADMVYAWLFDRALNTPDKYVPGFNLREYIRNLPNEIEYHNRLKRNMQS